MHDRTITRIARFLTTALAATLAACGGSSSEAPVGQAPQPVNPTLSISDASATEGNSGTTTLSFTVQASVPAGATAANASVDYATLAGTATAGSDFVAASGTLQFPAGTTQLTVDVEILADTDVETDETLSVTLSAPSNATLAQATATGTIRDDDTPVALSGLDARPDNPSCVAPARPTADAAIQLVDAYPALPSLSVPTKILLEPGADGRWFVLQKSGEIVTFPTASPTDLTPFIDLNDTRALRTDSEGGLLGMAFHPDYPATPEIFLSYTVQHTGPAMRSIVSRLVLDNVTTPGAGTFEQVIIEIDQDFDNHNGGDIGFGPDGLLYIGLGDGGSGNDPLNRSQDTTRLLGSMLRLEVRGTGAGYTIPSDNPFAPNPQCGPADNASDCPEIYAWGLRNPWRWSFDAATGALWLADVGQGEREEVNLIELGGNYGWRCREGTRDTANAGDCTGGGLEDPVTEYGRSDGTSITGGFVYRGTALPDLIGLYVFSDFGSGRFWAARPDGSGGFDNDELLNSGLNPTAFGVDPQGELVVVDISGRVSRLEAATNPTPDTIPEQLSQTGCVAAGDATQPGDGLVPYALNAPFWSDGADKDRYIGLPNGTTIDVDAAGDFDFPAGTVIVKNFRLNGALVETRHLMRHPDGQWAGYTYEWNAAQTEATRVRGGKVADVGGQQWIYPSESDCMACHTAAAGFALGPEVAQLNRNLTYAATGRTANQLETLEAVSMLSAPLGGPADTLPSLADPEDTGAALEERARAYLHSNCAGCHQPNGPTPSTMDLRFDTPLANTVACDAPPLSVDLGIANARLIAPGSSATSLVVERMRRRDVHGMPPIGSNVIDTAGVTVVSAWIDALTDCT